MKRVVICARMRPIFIFSLLCLLSLTCNADVREGFLVRKENRRTLVSTENGEILAARVGNATSHLLHFFTMDPNSLFLPVILHSDMVFYVQTGSGKLSWSEENELRTADLRRGDVYRLKEGAVFFLHSNLETEMGRQRLRIIAMFANSNTDLQEPLTGPYSSVRDMVLGFDKKVLQAAFKVSEEEVEELLNGPKPPAIIHEVTKSKRTLWEIETKILGSLMGGRSYDIFESNKNKKGKKSPKLFNLFKEDKDFENYNGWSTTVTSKKLSALKDSSIGLFMVNLTAGSMMGPHWNPDATEISVVLQGRGMIRVVCPSGNETGCESKRFEVEEGDVFVAPRFHPMAQMGFNNGSFVFMGFSDSERKNHPQFLAGQASVLRALDREVLAKALNVRNRTVDKVLGSQEESVILGCLSCAEEELEIVEKEREKEREEERKRKEEEEEERRKEEKEEAKRREEEEKERREEEEEEAREKEEEAARKREEERKRREEEEAEREEEERERQEEEEEEARRREEEEQKRREEEEEEAREEEEEEAKRQEEERKRRKEEEEAREEEEERKRREEEEEEAAREREEEEAERHAEERRKREEEERKRRKEEEARRQEEERQRREEEEEEEMRERERERRREHERARMSEEEEAQRQEEERERREQEEEEEYRRREEKARRSEEEEAQRQEEERERREQEEEEEEEEYRRREEKARRSEEEEAKRQEEERERHEQEEEEEYYRRREEKARSEEEEAQRQEEERERHEQEEYRRREEEEEGRWREE